MSATIWATILTAIAGILSTIITVTATNKHTLSAMDKKSELSDAKLEAKLEKFQAVSDTKIEELTREVRAHNGFAEKIPVIEEKIKVANKRIADLEQSVRQKGV